MSTICIGWLLAEVFGLMFFRGEIFLNLFGEETLPGEFRACLDVDAFSFLSDRQSLDNS